MTYGWEKKARELLRPGVQQVGKFRIRAIVVENLETAEGALIPLDKIGSSGCEADVWKDVAGDANRHYDGILEGWGAAV